MSKNPRVSVIIPTYNRQDLLTGAVKSVLNQSFTDFELIISDDASTDGTPQLCKKLAKSDPRIRYERHKNNLGMVGNWNAALDKARGKYCCILMDDDRFETNFLEPTQQILNKDASLGFVVVWLQHYLKESDGKETLMEKRKFAYKLYSKSKKISAREGFNRYLNRNLQIGLPSCILFRKTKLRFNKLGLDPGYWLDLMSSFGWYYYLDKPLCRQVFHGSQFSTDIPDKLDFYRQVFCANKALNYLMLDQIENISPDSLEAHRKITNSYVKNENLYLRFKEMMKYV